MFEIWVCLGVHVTSRGWDRPDSSHWGDGAPMFDKIQTDQNTAGIGEFLPCMCSYGSQVL